jgi:sugar lactone lactonase YvrE
LRSPFSVAIDGAGNLYIADTSDNRIRKVSAATGYISTVAGSGTACSSTTAACGDGGSAIASGANLNSPTGIAVDGAGNLYIADLYDNRIRKVTAATGYISTVAGSGTQCSVATATCGDGGSATATGANLYEPAAVALDGAGNLYIADENDNRIRKVTAATGYITTVAGSGLACTPYTSVCGDGGSATASGAELYYPYGVAVDAAGNIYIADRADNRVRKVHAAVLRRLAVTVGQ